MVVGDDGVRAGKPSKETVSKSCAVGDDIDTPRVKVKSGLDAAEQCTKEG